MDKELQSNLFNKYKDLFATRNRLDMGKLMMPIDFGIEFGNGWYFILDNLLYCIDSYIKNHNKWNKKEGEPDLTLDVTQIKEKFGGLRFYYNGGNDEIEGMVHLAETLCNNTCEECGINQDVGRTSGWIITLCKSCAEKAGKLEKWQLKIK